MPALPLAPAFVVFATMRRHLAEGAAATLLRSVFGAPSKWHIGREQRAGATRRSKCSAATYATKNRAAQHRAPQSGLTRPAPPSGHSLRSRHSGAPTARQRAIVPENRAATASTAWHSTSCHTPRRAPIESGGQKPSGRPTRASAVPMAPGRVPVPRATGAASPRASCWTAAPCCR
jgi:hypothetical protein